MKTKYVRWIFYILIVWVFGLFLVGEAVLPGDNLGGTEQVSLYRENWERIRRDGTRCRQEVPGKCEAERGEWIEIETMLPREIKEDTYLCFRSGKQDMNVLIDGQLRQQYNTDRTRKIGSFSPVAYIFVKIHPGDAGKKLTVRSCTGSNYTGIFYPVYQGSQMAVWKYFFKLYGGEIIVAFLTLVLSGICLIGTFVLRVFYHRHVDLTYLGLGVFLAGIWEVTNSVFRQLLFPNMSMVNDMAFYMIMLMPIPFLLYIDQIQKKRYTLICRIFEILAVVDFVVCTFLHVTGIVDFADTILLMVCVCIATILAIGVTMMLDAVHKYILQYHLVAIGMFCAFLSAIIQIVLYFQKTKMFSGVILAAGLIFLLIFATISTIVNITQMEKEKQYAMAASVEKGRFLANMSHEIRTPINTVLGFDTMILRESQEQNIRNYAVDIQNAGRTLLALINDILDLSKIESGKMEIIPLEYDFSSLIHDVISMVSMKAAQKQLQLEINLDEQLPGRLCGDDVRLRQILVNLLNNAVKYTRQGKVTLTVSGRKVEKEVLLHFEVRDTGIGIREEDMQKLFAAFERIEEKKTRNIEGTGLGMSITVQLLALMGSSLEVESTYGVGSTFSFDLRQEIINDSPIGNLQERLQVRQEECVYEVSFAAPEANILLVDDNPTNRKVFRSLLKETFVQIDEAESGKEALQKVEKRHYDLIMLDHMMPDIDGVSVLKQMHQMEAYPNRDTPVVALTANAITGAREMYLEAGFDDYLSKPINTVKMEKIICALLPKHLCLQGKQMEEYLAQRAEDGGMAEQETEQEMVLPEVEGIDWDFALLKLKKKQLVMDVAADMAQTAYLELEQLNTLWEACGENAAEEVKVVGNLTNTQKPKQGDREPLEAFGIKAHAMKSSAAMIGAMQVSALAKILEYAADERNTEKIATVLPLFAEEWNAMGERLQDALHQGSGRRNGQETDIEKNEMEKSTVSPVMLRQYLEMLEQAMEELDIDTADTIMEELGRFSFGEQEERIQKLAVCVRALDVEGTKSLINQIMLEEIKE